MAVMKEFTILVTPVQGVGYYTAHSLLSEEHFCLCTPHLVHGKRITLTLSHLNCN